MDADFKVENRGGVLVIYPQSDKAQELLGKIYSSTKPYPTTQAVIEKILVSGHTVENKSGHPD